MKTVFVSSTFRDMQFERDAIHNQITPRLNEKARSYGESVSFCDLRWGVNTENLDEKESSLKVLSVCLNEIERCRPYFVVILGDRYGFIPNSETIRDATKRENFKLDNEDCSITALEIEFGALSNADQMKRTFFYFREIVGNDVPAIYKAEDSLHTAKLEKLKEKITASGGRIKNYTLIWQNEQKTFTGIENFVDMLVADISNLMATEFQEYARLSEYEKDQHIQWEFAKQKSAQFAGRQHLIKNYVEILNSGVNFLAIKGESGSGKSTLMSQLAFTLRDEGHEVLPLFSSLTQKTSDASNITRYIVEELERKIPDNVSEYSEKIDFVQNHMNIQEKSPTFWANHKLLFKIFRTAARRVYKIFNFFYNLIKKVGFLNRQIEEIQNALQEEIQQQNNLAKFAFQKNIYSNVGYAVDWNDRLEAGVELWNSYVNKKFIILLDATDQLIDNNERDTLISLFSKFQDNVQIVISYLPNFEISENQQIKIETIVPPKPITQLEIINGILKYIGRELGEPVITEILKKVNSENPLYLSLLINRLTMMDKKDFDKINSVGGQISAINAQQIKILQSCSDDLDDLCVEIIDMAAEKIGGDFVNFAMRYIAISRYGLRESDLEHILTAKGVQWNAVDFALFVQYLSSFFVRRADGRIDFTHKNIRAGCLKLIKDKKSAHTDIFEHLKKLPKDDELRQTEIVWHCFNTKERNYFLNYIASNFEIETDSHKFSKNFSLYKECGYIFEMYGVNWCIDLLEYGKQEKFKAMRPILSRFWGQLFNSGEFFRIFDNGEPFNEDVAEQTLKNYFAYIRLNCREYPDLLIAVYCALGYFYNNALSKPNISESETHTSKRLARKFANKGIAVIKQNYTYAEIEKFIPIKHFQDNELMGISIDREEPSPRSKIVRLKTDIEGIELKDIEEYMKEISTYKR